MWFINNRPYPDMASAKEAVDGLNLAGIKAEVELDSCGGSARGGANGLAVSRPAE